MHYIVYMKMHKWTYKWSQKVKNMWEYNCNFVIRYSVGSKIILAMTTTVTYNDVFST